MIGQNLYIYSKVVMSIYIIVILSLMSILFVDALKLSLGDISETKSSIESIESGLLIVTFSSDLRPGKASILLDSVLTRCGGSLENFLPPSSFLIYT